MVVAKGPVVNDDARPWLATKCSYVAVVLISTAERENPKEKMRENLLRHCGYVLAVLSFNPYLYFPFFVDQCNATH
jgi:hypothetical protein